MRPEHKSRESGEKTHFITDASLYDNDLRSVGEKYSPWAILLITIVGIAIAEIIAMIVIYFFRHLPYYQQVLLDAAIMTVIIFPLLYILSFRPLLLHIQQRYQVEKMLRARLRIIQYAETHHLDDLLRFTLDEIEALTASRMGYFHLLDSDEKTIKLQVWSTNTIDGVSLPVNSSGQASIGQADIWADCIHQKKAVVHNDFASLHDRTQLPDEHIHHIREMAVPIIREGKVVAILGVGHKAQDFSNNDVNLVSTLADFAWDIVRHRQAGDALRQSEEKFRTLVDWTYDWEMWLDPTGTIIYNSPSCERITGYNPVEFIQDLNLLFQIVHPYDRAIYQDHHQLVHDETAGVEKIEYRVLSRSGELRWIEHVCRPLFDANNQYLGRRISNRDITERKQAEKEIEERNQKEKSLTQTIHTMQLDIARDLHDTVGQNISLLRMKLDFLAGHNAIKKSDMQTEIRSMTKVANESYDLMRGTLAVLQSSNSGDLFRVFSRYAEQIEERSSFKVKFSTTGEAQPLSAKRMRQLFFVYRETLNNIEKHANATQTLISIEWRAESLCFTVTDNGQGFDPTKIKKNKHFGLKFMRERVESLSGSLDIQSQIGSGTKIMIQVPYE